jgi:hypothetical protein
MIQAKVMASDNPFYMHFEQKNNGLLIFFPGFQFTKKAKFV